MTSSTSCDLGHGVRVMPGDGDGIVVVSAEFDLEWRPRHAGRPGSAVVWEESGFEVVERESWRRGARWILEPWTGDDVMRVVLPLDGAAVAAAARAAQRAARAAKLRGWFWIAAPILGFAPASRQRRWLDRYAFPATLATSMSAILEIAVGAVCVIELLASVLADGTPFPWIPRPLVLLGFFIFIEGAVRLAIFASDPGPVGSLFGIPLEILDHRGSVQSETIPAPTVQAFDVATGTLDLLSSIHRRDWSEPGVLPYRGELFTLATTDRLGEDWVYRFQRTEAFAEPWATRLRLVPPRSRMDGRSFADQPGAVETVLLTIAATLAPRRYQERWAERLGVRASWFTVMGASAELVGGLANLGGVGDRSEAMVLLNLFFCAEAVVRFGSLIFRGQPLGSVFGLPLATVLEKYLPGRR